MGRGEAGAGILGTVLGAGVFLLLLLFAVQVLVGLYATSVVTAATYDAAKSVAGADLAATPLAQADAERTAQAQLGDYGRRVTFEWGKVDEDGDGLPDAVLLRARAPRPSFLPQSLLGGVGLGDIQRTVRVRLERLR
ncbi:MAG: hypothetical protein M3Q48_16965 [Actinomycetota bacterium]|nr:hypothetical protein [Actinomycetota bacterium]